MRSPADLHPYQTQAADFLYDRPGAALFAGLGTGKTAVSLTLLARLKAEGLLGRALVIGPLRVVNAGWPAEIAAWSHTRGLTHAFMTGPTKVRYRALELRADVHLINRENVEWLVSQFVRPKPGGKWEMYRRWPYDVVIADEFTSFGDAGSKRFRALKLVRKHIKRFYGLTATPTAEGYMKMFAMCYLLDRGERLGTHITHYREAYFAQNPYTHQWTIRPRSAEQITDKVADIVLTVPSRRGPPAFIDVPVALTDEQMEVYLDFEREAYLQAADGTEITAVHSAALATKLLQLSSGFTYDAEGRAHHFHNAKVEALEELIEAAQGEPVIVAYWFRESLAQLRKAFPKARTLDAKGAVIDEWNAGRVPILLLHPASGGVGLNLQHGGRIMVFYDVPASLEMYLQTTGRIDRQGQERPVLIYHLVATGTADETATERLRQKESVMAAFFKRLEEVKRAIVHKK